MYQRSAPKLDHLERLCAEHGIIQFARYDEPDRASGFCLDDNVRLLVVCVTLLQRDKNNAFAQRAGEDVLTFIEAAARQAPRYHNVMDGNGHFIDRFASPESIGRLIRALGMTVRDSSDPRWRTRASRELARATAASAALSTEHARAFAILGFAAAVEAGETDYRTPLRAAAEATLFELGRNSSPEWYWPLDALTYDNARMPEALLRAGEVLGDAVLHDEGMRMLEFLAGIVQPGEHFEPIGADKWYPRNGERTYYAQQPLEALAMMDAWLAVGERSKARMAYEWFVGNNRDELVVADLRSGGSCDGIEAPGVLNENMGAESTLAYVEAALNVAAPAPASQPITSEREKQH